MNKQVVSFLSLFSLVLVLSIYYVMIPVSGAGNNTRPVDGQISSGGSEATISDASNLFFTTLEENRKARHDEVKNAQIEILASADYSNDEKLEARTKLTFEELVEDTELGLEQAMSELQFNDVFIEKLDSYFYVTAYDSTMKSDEDLGKVLSIAEAFSEYFTQHEAENLKTCRPVVNFVSF